MVLFAVGKISRPICVSNPGVRNRVIRVPATDQLFSDMTASLAAYRRVLIPCLIAVSVFVCVLSFILKHSNRISDSTKTDLIVVPTESALVLVELPDFRTIRDVTERKQRFFSLIRPIIEEENNQILRKRRRLLALMGQHGLNGFISPDDLSWLNGLADEYKVVGFSVENETSWNTLMMRVDIIPAPLAMVQAAMESAWGTSRLSRAGNNLYGQWCFATGCGIVPAERDSGATHEIARFNSINHSVRSYMRNLNTHGAYGTLRRLRQEQRMTTNELDSYALAGGLVRYSERRGEYVKEIRSMLRYNQAFFVSV